MPKEREMGDERGLATVFAILIVVILIAIVIGAIFFLVKNKATEIINDNSNESNNISACTDTCSSLGYKCGVHTVCGQSVNCGKCSSSSGGGGGGSGGGSGGSNGGGGTICTDTCASLAYQCGIQTICGSVVVCGNCLTGYTCNGNGLCVNQTTCADSCNSLNYQCGTHTICGNTLNCGTCLTGFSCQANGTCVKDAVICNPTTCNALGRTCGSVSNGCTGTLNCGTCSTNFTCQSNGTCVISSADWACGDILDYQCGIRNICGENVNYGNCPTGYNCNNNLCIASDTKSCTGVSCASGEYCSHGVCLLNVPGNTYFVATWGNNNNPGTFLQPWATWQKAVEVSQPGDITYIRGGVWKPTELIGRTFGMLISGPESYNVGRSGTAEAPIRYFNYPGEKPIVDGEFMLPPAGWNYGISIEYAEHISLRGLTVRHVYQSPPEGGAYTEAFGIGSDGANIHYENMVVHDIDGRGFQHWSLWEHKLDNTSWINCDAYNLYDRYSRTPGNAADGWLVASGYGNNISFEGCRAFNYSDDGFNTFGNAYFTFKNCWAMSTEKYKGLSEDWNMEGSGFKLNGVNKDTVPGYTLGGEIFAKVENCIAAYCVGSGLGNNLEVYLDDTSWPNNGLFYNNLGYKDYAGFWDGGANQGGDRSTVYKNNIAYGSTSEPLYGKPAYEVGIYRPSIYPHSNNTWIGTMEEDGWPGWEYNPAYTVTDGDFVSLDYWQLTRPRKADFSLPDITFGHLAQGSDLIDGGIVIPSYHCATAGAHPGQNCREWYGSAPDLGPFESNY